MKTAVTVLQEMMIKMGLMPEYECVAQSGPQHQALFEYRCLALGEVVSAAARSKKEAKQEVARVMLHRLAAKGHPVPAPFGMAATVSTFQEDEVTTGSPADTRSYVALLKELCEEYHLAGVQYELVGDTGPPHLRHFTMRARLGQHERFATSTTKKAARQLAAEKLYTYLRENLARVTRDFDEEEALARAHAKAMERCQELDEPPRRPDLGQRIADYHLGIVSRIDAETRDSAVALLDGERLREPHSPERILTAVGSLLRLELGYSSLARDGGEGELAVLHVTGAPPDLAFAGCSRAGAALEALEYVRLALQHDPPPPPPPPPLYHR